MNAEEKVDEAPTLQLKEKCVRCLKGVNLIKTIIILACCAVVLQQIVVCIKKLVHIPITTYTHFDFNKTIMYPSVTFCREPPYKYDKLLEYGLYSDPRYPTSWANFDFSNVTLDDLWRDVTYNDNEIFVQYRLGRFIDDVMLKPNIGLIRGRCYTLSPKVQGTRATKSSGYSITLKHSVDDVNAGFGNSPPGYHVYVHYTKEPFTEVEVYNGGLVNFFYANIGETIEVKLTVDEYVKIGDEDDPCTYNNNYSANLCTAQYVWNKVEEQVGCSGPWMMSNLRRCDNATAMMKLITAYRNLYEDHDCSICPRFCRSYLYNAYVTDRQSFYSWSSDERRWYFKTGTAALQTQLYIYFNGMMVSVYEESYNYDWNLFVSDLGGSIGFLLGLSVIGLIKIFDRTWSVMIQPFIKAPKAKDNVSESTITAEEKAGKDQQFIEKYKQWTSTNKLRN